MRAASLLAPLGLATAAVAASTSAAAARPFDDIGGGAQLHYELSDVHLISRDAAMAPASDDLVMAGARLHGFAGGTRWGYHVGLDLAAGSTVRASGFAYDVSLFPVGVALRFAQTSFVTLGAGIGASGAVGTVDDALTFPLELRFEVGRGIRVLGRARATYLWDARDRKDGGMLVDVGDELEATLALRLGHGYTDWGFPTGNGYFVGASAREATGARFVGIVIGYSVDMGTRRTELDRDRVASCPYCE